MSDNDIIVHFRREKTHTEAIEEKTSIERRGEEYDSTKLSRWVYVGETIMSSVPDTNESIWVNGVHYQVVSRSWSVAVAERPGQPNFEDTHVMLTLGDYMGRFALVPVEDFRN